MTEMTKEMESRTWEQMTEVYGLAVILVICVIGVSEFQMGLILLFIWVYICLQFFGQNWWGNWNMAKKSTIL